MSGLPEPNEAAPYFFKYINLVQSDDVVGVLETQLDETVATLHGITEEKSLHRYAPDKWSIRQVLNHVTDTERVFLFRAFWFARGFDTPLPSFDEKVSAAGARADEVSWAQHVEEFRGTRLATVTFFRNLPAEAWTRSGIASDNPISVRALAYILAGHAAHHMTIIQERYL
jgi:uncharacterized damage-inducible protein DinB